MLKNEKNKKRKKQKNKKTMGKFNLTGQVAVLDNADAKKAKASGAVTDSGYLGGTSWIKTQLDAAKQFYKGDPNEVPGYEFVNFADANEGLVIPDGAFDFFDLTYDLTQKDVKECLIQFRLDQPAIGFKSPSFSTNMTSIVNSNTYAINLAAQAPNMFGWSQNPVWIVTNDYTECGFAGMVLPGGENSLPNAAGYKITGQDPPTDDSGSLYQIYPDGADFYRDRHIFAQYKDATDSQTGMRYMVGLYGNVNDITGATNDFFVIKSMSINVTPAGLNQFVLHCRKAQATTSHTINADGRVQGIHILKINY